MDTNGNEAKRLPKNELFFDNSDINKIITEEITIFIK